MTAPDLGPANYPAEPPPVDLDEVPRRPITSDRLYVRCVWCDGEQYMPAVIRYSSGDVGCTAVHGCGRYVPESYRRKAALS